MAIVKMKRLRLAAMKQDREELLRLLQRMGCVEIDEPDVDRSDPEWAALSSPDGTALARAMERRGEGVLNREFCLDFLKMLFSTALMAAAAAFVLRAASGVVPGKLGLLVTLGLSACAGVVVYFASAAALRLDEAKLTASLARQLLKRG